MSTATVGEMRIEEVQDDALRQEAFRLRRSAYCSRGVSAGGEGHGLRDDDDDTGVVLVARRGDELLGTARMNWLDAGLSSELGVGLQLHRFLEYTEAARVVVASRLAVAPQYRRGLLFGLMMIAVVERAAARHFEVGLCDCQPHLVHLYLRLGLRTYAPVFEHGEAGVAIPLVLLGDDLEHLEDVRSPPTAVLSRSGPPRCSFTGVRSVVQGTCDTGIDLEWGKFGTLYGSSLNRAGLLAGLDDAERERLLERGTVLALAPGQRLIVQAQPTRTMFVILDGVLEVMRDSRVVGFVSSGNVVGEVEALLDCPRAATVTARQRSKVLAISDRVLRRVLQSEPRLAAKVTLNLAREIAGKLVSQEATLKTGTHG